MLDSTPLASPCLGSPCHRIWPSCLAALLLVAATPVRAGSVTADSIIDRESARQAALEQVPRGATTTGSRCQEIGVGGMDNPRYRCTVEYRPAEKTPTLQPPAPPTPSSSTP
jgi:hypothetical protein